ncbi:Eco57I restriction-modification methylase domain-containing protein [Streptomyces sp. enrichment culture]|uniref:Eco57I restriction-modification methylase domain-containing protein n=1 Tax=Streptomyces sp. enrichment culture TaxID=1795815 RepID=UPI003F575CCE
MDQVSADKLRGGFYSPPALVAVCLERLQDLLPASSDRLRLLEPSAGDGAFIRGLEAHPLRRRIGSLAAVELLPSEAQRCSQAGDAASFPVVVRQGSFLDPDLVPEEDFDGAIGNPPFVRFQFVSDLERSYADRVAMQMGVPLKGVSNLWIPILLCALNKLREGGAFAFIIPAECLTGISASVVRKWILVNCVDARIDLFAPGSFPGVLQEVVVLSGRKKRQSGDSLLTVRECDGVERIWKHVISPESPTWTRYLLSPSQLEALQEISLLPLAKEVGNYVRFSVATVTGANEYFSVDSSTVEEYGLQQWVVPLLPRIRHANGLVFSKCDHRVLAENGIRAGLLDFSLSGDPKSHAGAAQYIAKGEDDSLHTRYKCRIRDPWYCVPVVRPGDLLLSKRSHHYPRVVVNEAEAITTDTIYQGRMLGGHQNLRDAFAASFHNSFTLLTAEIEGRSFGGGVLELVPSEVARLLVIVPDSMGDELVKLDAIARSGVADVDEVLIRETDRRLAKFIPGLSDSALNSLAEARLELQKRRLDRNRASV